MMRLVCITVVFLYSLSLVSVNFNLLRDANCPKRAYHKHRVDRRVALPRRGARPPATCGRPHPVRIHELPAASHRCSAAVLVVIANWITHRGRRPHGPAWKEGNR